MLVIGNYFERYKARVTTLGQGMADISRNRVVESVNAAFANAPDYIEVIIDGKPVGCRMIEDRTTREGYRISSTMKTLLFMPSVEYPVGTYIGIGDDTWFITDYAKDVVPKAHVQKCNNVMKFINDNDKLIERPVFIQNKSLYTTGVADGRVMSLPDAKVSVSVPLDGETLNLARDKRFLFGYSGKYFAYKTTLVDIVTINGLALLIMEEDVFRSDDNLELGIADYRSHDNDDPSPTIIITGGSEIRIGAISNYVADQEVVWSIVGEDGTTTTYASIVESTSTTCVVKAGSTANKKVVLKASLVADMDNVVEHLITIRSLF